MKTLKRAEQKNVCLSREFYTTEQIRRFIEEEKVAVFNEQFKQLELNELDFMYDSCYALDNYSLRIFLCNTVEIKVVYKKEYNFYNNVVIMKDGSEIAIEL